MENLENGKSIETELEKIGRELRELNYRLQDLLDFLVRNARKN